MTKTKKKKTKSIKPVKPFEKIKLEKEVSSYVFLGIGKEKWHIRVHILPEDFSNFTLKLISLVLALLQNPRYSVPNPFAHVYLKQLEKALESGGKVDKDTTRYIG